MIDHDYHECDFNVGPPGGACTICGQDYSRKPTPAEDKAAKEAAILGLTCFVYGVADMRMSNHTKCPGVHSGRICGCNCLDCAEAVRKRVSR